MTSNDLISLSDFIKAKNTYFNNGYGNAFKDSETGHIMAFTGTDLKPLFPNDTLGNYFYIRVEGSIKHNPRMDLRPSDYGVGRLAFDDVVNMTLVAVVKDANEYTLINNLRDTALLYTNFNAVVANSSFIKPQIIVEEMKGHDDKDIKKALSTMKNKTIVKLTLQASIVYVPQKCIVDPCTC